MKLNVGCGPHRAEGWLNIDVVSVPDHDIVPDLVAPANAIPLPDGSAECIYLGHMLEHVRWEEVAQVLGEMRRLLAPGGQLAVVGPDTRRAMAMWRDGEIDDEALDAIVENEASYQGAGDWDGARHQWNCHSDRVVLALHRAGFVSIAPVPIASDKLDDWPVVSRIGWQCAVLATTDCVFCAIVAGKSPARFVRRWDDAIAIEPLNPVVKGHVLVIPRAHVPDAATDPEVTAAVFRRVAELAAEMDDELDGGLDSFNLITSAGPAATQTVFHFHAHIVPRRLGDGLVLPWTPTR